MNSLDATETVLVEAGKPLHYTEITHKIIEQGLWQTDGKTPEATINASLAVDIKRLGQNSRFCRVDKGIFALRIWSTSELEDRSDTNTLPTVERKVVLSFTDATEYVLENHSGRIPMHYREITEKILELGLVDTQGWLTDRSYLIEP